MTRENEDKARETTSPNELEELAMDEDEPLDEVHEVSSHIVAFRAFQWLSTLQRTRSSPTQPLGLLPIQPLLMGTPVL